MVKVRLATLMLSLSFIAFSAIDRSYAQSNNGFDGIIVNTADKIVVNGVEYFAARSEVGLMPIKNKATARRFTQRKAMIAAEALLSRKMTNNASINETSFEGEEVIQTTNQNGDVISEKYTSNNQIERSVTATLKSGVQVISVNFKDDSVEVVLAIPVSEAF